MSFGILITTYRESLRPGLLERALEIASDRRVDEVVISDDASEDLVATYDRVQRLGPELRAKLKFVTQPENLGVFGNKLSALRAAQSDWVQSLDSDNCLSSTYLDRLFPFLGDPDRVLCPTFARPEFDYRERAGESVTLTNFPEFLRCRWFGCFMNTGNQCCHRETMLAVLKDLPALRHDRYIHDYFAETELSDLDHRRVYDSADSLLFNKLWLESGRRLYLGPGLEYDHAIHQASSWLRAPGLKAVMPPIYFRELLDARARIQRRFRYLASKRWETGDCAELIVNGRVDDRIHVDYATGHEVQPLPPRPPERPVSTRRFRRRRF
jgi:glycosyltransferase involved in cell wall biosynthesis